MRLEKSLAKTQTQHHCMNALIVRAVAFKDVIAHGFEIYQMDSMYIYICVCVCKCILNTSSTRTRRGGSCLRDIYIYIKDLSYL